jgi:hypothetical protein
MKDKKKDIKKKYDFNNYKSFSQYISKNDYDPKKILNKVCKITEKEYDHFLNVLYPAFWVNSENGESSFYLNECLTEDIYYKFFNLKEEYWCIVERINKISKEDLIKENMI